MTKWYPQEQTALALIRIKAGMSRDKAAVMLGVAPNTLLRYEHGKNDIGLEIIDRMVSLYGVPFEDVCNAARKVRMFSGAIPSEQLKQEVKPA